MTDELKDIKTIFRIIQSVPSKKLNPSSSGQLKQDKSECKKWLTHQLLQTVQEKTIKTRSFQKMDTTAYDGAGDQKQTY